jgi:hypothetical protein
MNSATPQLNVHAGAAVPEAGNPTAPRDWRTPVLLTLSLHLMALTLFINHRLFVQVEGPEPGRWVSLAAISQDSPPDQAQTQDADDPADKDEAAANEPEPQAPDTPTIEELLREATAAPKPPERVKPEQATDRVVPDTAGMAELLDAAADAAAPPAWMPPGSHVLRSQAGRRAGLRRHGGSTATENAVEAGLAWLAGVQSLDGRWDSDGYMEHYLPNPSPRRRMEEGVGLARNDVGITALCLLAFTGAGYTEREGHYAATVRAPMRFLLSRQRPEDGGFGLPQDTYRVTMYGHALATLALTDLFLLTGEQGLRAPLQRAVDYLCAMQGPGGGWDYGQRYPDDKGYTSSTRNDLSITGWAAMALATAREAGLQVPRTHMERLAACLAAATRTDGEALYANEGVRAGHRGMAMLAVSSVCRRMMGEAGSSAVQQRQAARIDALPPDWSAAGELLGSNMYYWYYGSIALLLARDDEGGLERWQRWNVALQRELLPRQSRDGPRAGSFDPVGQWARNGGGRLYSTAICVLTLEIYYRYEPEYLRARAAELAALWPDA